MLKVITPPWLALGFYRGVKLYNYDLKKKTDEYEIEENRKYYNYEKPIYFYSNCFGEGLFGLIMYANPITLPIIIPKEIYRLEVNIRGMNEEKEKPSFYEII